VMLRTLVWAGIWAHFVITAPLKLARRPR